MKTFLLVVFLMLCGAVAVMYFLMKRAMRQLAAAKEEAQAAWKQREIAVMRAQNETKAAMENAQAVVERKSAEAEASSERIRAHYETEVRKAIDELNSRLNQALAELEPLRKYASLRGSEEEVRKTLANALVEATALRAQAEALIEQTRASTSEERRQAQQRAREIRGQAEAALMQATVEAGRIIAKAEKQAEQIGGDAYVALRDKHTLEQAVSALWNVVEGYGDRYIIPSRSLLDDLAREFGRTEAGEALITAREHTRRMVELRQAANCNYEEADRRERANRFVVDAFNGRVDAILTRIKRDNYGTLEQELRDAFNLVNLNGLTFRDARILPAYLDARLTELRWAAVVQELKRKEIEEQRAIREEEREEEILRREAERASQEAQKAADISRQAKEAVQKQIEETTQELQAKLEQAKGEQRVQLEQEYQERFGKLTAQLQEKDQQLREAEEKKREISNAQLTRKGHVYIISNIGSFGEEVYKIGMTRRNNPDDRIWELSGASVPFDFDIHAKISSEDAPALERMLHQAFDDLRINKVNYRKEFFRLPLDRIRAFTNEKGLDATFTMKAEAYEYRKTLDLEKMTPAEREKYRFRKSEGNGMGEE
jgi:serine phosphatase RsbU (regulator of sigma subunit)